MAPTALSPGEPPRPRPLIWDATAFVAVLVTGMCLIFIGHTKATDFGLYVGALISLYAAWRSR
jgi:hypothetical protein